ncbi:MAG: molybdopterin cofactor-binding domain-containing protein, partial [Gemmatimonadales bacterium]
MIADFNPETGQLDIYNGNQAPHAHRTVYAHVAGLAEHMIRIRCNDIGGGFGNKVPVYPGYVCAIAGSIVAGVPVKWIEDRTGNLTSTGFARDYIMHAEMCAKDGKITGLRVDTIADHGAFDSTAQPTKFPAGFFHIVCGSYDLQASHVKVKAVYTNKAPGGVAYRCSFRITEAVYLVERMVEALALEMHVDPIDLRMQSFIGTEQFPYETTTGWTYDSGDYHKTMRVAMDIAGYEDLRQEQEDKRARGELMGIGISSFTEAVGAGPSHTFDILGLKMFDSCEIRVHPTGKAIARFGTKSQGQGHETTYAQIVAEELGIPAAHVQVEEGDTDTAPYGLGTYASRSTPTAGAAGALAARTIREKAKKIAAHLLEANEQDVEWKDDAFRVRGSADQFKSFAEVALMANVAWNMPAGVEPGLEASAFFDPSNFVYPFGSHVCTVEVDLDTGEVKILRYIAVDDCGPHINPMIVEGQIHGGIVQGLGEGLQEIAVYDDDGQLITGTMMDYAVPKASQMPRLELDHTVTPSPVNPLGIKGCGEAGTIASAACLVNAVCDALAPLGILHIDKPLTPARVWAAIQAAKANANGGGHPGIQPGASPGDAQTVPGAVGPGKENVQ